MSNETTIENGAADAASETKQNPDRTLVGKIARLPKDIREELNHRIDDNQPGSEILPWLNGLPAVKTILDKYFRGVAISDANLSQWKRVGYKRWQEKQESEAELRLLAEDTQDFFDATGGKVARIAAMKILKLLQTIPAEQSSISDLTKISHAISALLSAEQNQARLEYEKTRVFQGNERLVLSWDKHLRGCIDSVQRALKDAICKDIEAANIDNSEKIELMGHHMFGKKWQGRKIKKKEAVKKEPEGPKKESAGNAEVKKTEGQTADQQVRPTTEEKAEVKEADAQQVPAVKDAVEVEGPQTQSPPHPSQTRTTHEPALAPLVSAPDGGDGGREARPATPPNPKQKPAVREAQAAPVKNVQPKPSEDSSVPKPSPWDAFSEPVIPSPFASFHGTLRPDSWKNKLG